MPWHSAHKRDRNVASNETNLLNLPVEAWYSWNKTAFLGVLLSKKTKEKTKQKQKQRGNVWKCRQTKQKTCSKIQKECKE